MAKLLKDIPGFENWRFDDLFKDEEVLMYDPTTRRTTRINTATTVPLSAEQERARVEMWTGTARIHAAPPFRLEERQREADHVRQVRRDKKRRELGEMYPDTPGRWLDDAVDQAIPRIVPVTSPRVTGGWTPPAKIDYNQIYADVPVPELQSANCRCKVMFNAASRAGYIFPNWLSDMVAEHECLQEEVTTSMYDQESIENASDLIEREKIAREAQEIIERVEAFGEDDYADGTVWRFAKSLPVHGGRHMKAYTYTALRYTDDITGKTWWSLSSATGVKLWYDLVFWLVTVGGPVAHADIEVWPPAVFPHESGTAVETTITGTVQ